ncbi:MAG: hypothetical protein ACKO2N_05705 [Tabrizicola sp.]
MLNTLIVLVVYECLVALAFLLCWRLVRKVDTRLPLLASDSRDPTVLSRSLPAGATMRGPPGAHWQIFAMLVSAAVLVGVGLALSGTLGNLREAVDAADPVFPALQIDPKALPLILPLGQLAILLVLYLRFRNAVQFPAIVVHLLLLLFCLLVTLLNPARIEPGRLTLVPIFSANLVLLILTHGLLTLLFCRSLAELLGAVLLAVVAGCILAIGTAAISLVSTLLGGPLFFFQLYLISAFGIFGLYFCVTSIALSLWSRD